MRDRSQFIGISLIICALALAFTAGNNPVKPDQGAIANVGSAGEAARGNLEGDGDSSAAHGSAAATADAEKPREERLFIIGNDVIDVTISDVGGAIKSAALKKYRVLQDQPDVVVFNEGSDSSALALFSDGVNFNRAYQSGNFTVISATENGIKLAKTLANGCVVTRQYSVAAKDGEGHDGYVIKHETVIENNTNIPVNIGNVSLCLGTMPILESGSHRDFDSQGQTRNVHEYDRVGNYLNFGSYNGAKANFIRMRDFEASNGFLGLGKKPERKQIFSAEKILWASIKNKFFTAILTPETNGDGYATWPVSIGDKNTGEKKEGMAALMTFNGGIIDCQGKKVLASEFYVGPKDFSRLSAFGKEQSRVMQFGFFGAISELLLWMMLKIYAVMPNWGLAIIVLTTMVKLLLWPLTNAQVRSSKKMAAVNGPLKLIREKFKNNPQKLQAETLKLFKENQINPAAGCLPIFIQIPIFLGLYGMLCSSSDLRFAHFLWIRDLSLPDTIAHIGVFPINILPLLMVATMVWQMRMTPMPTVDGGQKLVFKLMPIIFLLGCYGLPSGLVLYWTVQNLLTIGQQFTMSRKMEAQPEKCAVVPGPIGKKYGEKRVTRTNKRRK